MAVTFQSITIPFNAGLDLKSSPLLVNAPQLLSCQNGIFTQGGTITKRNGFGTLPQLTRTISSASVPTPPVPPLNYASYVLADGPLLYWRLTDTPATATAKNLGSAGSAQNLTYSSATPGLGATPLLTDPADASATSFSTRSVQTGGVGITGVVTNLPTSLSAFSVECWLNPETITSGYSCLFALSGTGSTNLFNLFWVSGSFNFWSAGGSIDAYAAGLTANTTHHVVFTYDGTNTYWYRDGVLVQTTNNPLGTLTLTYTTGYYAFVGTDGPGHNYDGNEQEVAFYTYALTGTQILNHYNQGT